jgi:nucleotide-binding universal stress UspA family protein
MAGKREKRRLRGAYPYRVLLPLAGPAEARALLPLADLLARERQGRVFVLQVAPGEAGRSRRELTRFLAETGRDVVQLEPLVGAAQEVWDGIWETVEREKIGLLLLGWRSEVLPETAVDELTDPRLAAPPCDVVAVRPGAELAGPEGWRALRNILLPVRGGPHSAMALRVAQALAGAMGAAITLLHEVGRPPREAEAQLFTTFVSNLRSLERINRTMTNVGDVAQAIVEEADQYQAVVMGASVQPVTPGCWGGPILDTVAGSVKTTLIVAKAHPPPPAPELEVEQYVSAWRDRPIAVVVDRWFAENTFNSDEFAALEKLVALKQEQNLTISLGLPALNEEETVGDIIRAVKTALMERLPLLDEMALIDSDSTDRTREIAAGLGVPVYIHREILPRYGAYQGKGETLWKSLYVLKGDIVAWIDTDIRNIHPRFVYGILGPLLRDRRIQYVKGFYQRPLKQGDKLIAGGGGRVTELTARPLINLFFPELSGLIQPLAGEYAGRREVLEQLPFFTGYGVETGLLIDVLEQFGLQAIAQVDLLKRVHRNQSLQSLSKMSFAIIRVIVNRLEARHKIRLLEEINETMNLIRYRPGYFYLEAAEIQECERPPMITLPEYRRRRGLEPPGVRQAGTAGKLPLEVTGP